MSSNILSPLFKEDEIQSKVSELAKKLDQDKNFDSPPVFICVLKGASFFFSDLIRLYPNDCKIDFIGCSSYGSGKTSSGEVKLTTDISLPVKGEHVVLVEDIVDTGHTLKFLVDFLKSRQVKSLTTVSLLEKPEALVTDVQVDYSCFTIENEFVVGYGLDFNNLYRNLKDISVLTDTSIN